MLRRISILIIAATLFYPVFGCGRNGAGDSAAGPSQIDQQLAGQWAGQKLNANGERLIVVFDTSNGSHNITIELNKPGQTVRQVDTGHFTTASDKINFLLSTMGDKTLSYTLSNNLLTLDNETYAKVNGSLSGPTVSGQIVINDHSRDDSVSVASLSEASLRPAAIEGEIVVRMKSGEIQRVTVPADSPPPALSTESTGLLEPVSALVAGQESHQQKVDQVLERLRADRHVASAGRNLLLHTDSLPNDPLVSQQYYLNILNVPFPAESGGSDTVVAVVDTGVRTEHPDLANAILKTADGRVIGYDFVEDMTVTGQADAHCNGQLDTDTSSALGPDADPRDPGQGGFGYDNWHGTHISGTIAAGTDNGTGIAGIGGPHVKIMPIRTMGRCGQGSLDAVANAIRFAVKLPNPADCATEDHTNTDGTITKRLRQDSSGNYICNYDTLFGSRPVARVINLSLGILMAPGSDGFDVLNEAVNDAAQQKGAIIVASVGNDGRDFTSVGAGGTLPYPAANPNVLAIGAVNPNLTRASYSNQGAFLKFVTPGGSAGQGILSTINPAVGNGYGPLVGTSQAAGLASGVVARILSQDPSLDRTGLFTLLQQTAVPLSGGGFSSEFGYGLINARAALNVAMGVPASGSPVLALSSGSMDLGTLGTAGSVLVQNEGGGSIADLTVTTQMASGTGSAGGTSWLTCTLSQASTPARLEVSVDRANLSQGDYSGSCDVHSAAGSQSLQVQMTVGVVAMDNQTRDSLRQTVEDFIAQKQRQSGGGSTDQNNPPVVNTIDVGTVTIFLLDASKPISSQCGGNVPWVTTDLSSDYHFELHPGSGSYYLFAGVDTNRDGQICSSICSTTGGTTDPEPCWAYPTLGNPQPVTITNDTQLNNLSWQFF